MRRNLLDQTNQDSINNQDTYLGPSSVAEDPSTLEKRTIEAFKLGMSTILEEPDHIQT